MIVHVVFFRFKDENKKENMLKAKADLEALQMEGLLKMEVGFDFVGSQRSWDMSLYSQFESKEALDEYQVYEPHVKIKEFLGANCKDMAAVDYEI